MLKQVIYRYTTIIDNSLIYSRIIKGKEINHLEHTSILTAVANHPNDLNLVLLGAKHEVLAWDIRTNKTSQSYKYKSAMGQVFDNIFN